MPLREENVRVSVRELEESKDPDTGIVKKSHSHLRYQTLDSLTPMRGSRAHMLSRADYEADWVAIDHRKPKIKDGWLLVTFVGGEPELYLRVEKRLQRSRKQHLLLTEVSTIQS